MLFKKIACVLLALVLATEPLMVNATDLGSAFSKLVGAGGGAATINSPGHFSSAARSGFSGGGVELRVPRGGAGPQLFSVSTPSISAGCNGISMHFGGFSFISGQEFVQLLKNIASGAALGFVSSLVMKTLCPSCEAVVQELRAAAQAAARYAKDACAIGQDWAKKFQDGDGKGTDVPDSCSRSAADSGAASDYSKAVSSICSGIRASTDWLNNHNPQVKGTGPAAEGAKAELQCITDTGNTTWLRLIAFDEAGSLSGIADDANARKLLLINLLGAEMTFSGSAIDMGCDKPGGNAPWKPDASDSTKNDKNYCAPTMDMKGFVDVFMCGGKASRGAGMSPAGKTYCDALDAAAGGDLQMWGCKADSTANAADNYATCPYLKMMPVSTVFKGQGFLVRVNTLLTSAVERVRTGTGYDDAEGKQIIALINAAPYPLYQAINAAAVYPSAATELLDTLSVMVAETFVHVMIDEMMRLEGRASSKLCMPRAQAIQVLNFVNSLRELNEKSLAKLATSFTIQQQISEQIRTLNIAIQREVMSEELLQSGKLGQQLNHALTPTNAGQGLPAPVTAP